MARSETVFFFSSREKYILWYLHIIFVCCWINLSYLIGTEKKHSTMKCKCMLFPYELPGLTQLSQTTDKVSEI